MKYACSIVTAILVLFTYWQLNDATQYGNHDNWFWVVYYASATLLTALYLRKPGPPRWLYASFAGFSLGSCLFRMQDEVGNFDFASIFRATAVPSQMNATTQAPNEEGGLLLVALWLAFVAWKRGRAGLLKET